MRRVRVQELREVHFAREQQRIRGANSLELRRFPLCPLFSCLFSLVKG